MGHRQSFLTGLALLLFPALLLLPPALNILSSRLDLFGREKSRGAGPVDEEELAGLKARVQSLERELELEQQRRQRVEGWKARKPGHAPRLLSVLPIQDPDAARRAIYAWVGEGSALPERAVVVHEDALVGRVDDDVAFESFLRIQTIADPGFRVAFRSVQTWGFLRGTGDLDATGRPLLRILFEGREAIFEPGQVVFTDDDDPLYPSGIKIGEIVRAPESDPDPVLVRAALHPDDLKDVVVLVRPFTETATAAED